jgi:hypothetical protein
VAARNLQQLVRAGDDRYGIETRLMYRGGKRQGKRLTVPVLQCTSPLDRLPAVIHGAAGVAEKPFGPAEIAQRQHQRIGAVKKPLNGMAPRLI